MCASAKLAQGRLRVCLPTAAARIMPPSRPANHLYELSRVMTTGMSAPPMLAVMCPPRRPARPATAAARAGRATEGEQLADRVIGWGESNKVKLASIILRQAGCAAGTHNAQRAATGPCPAKPCPHPASSPPAGGCLHRLAAGTPWRRPRCRPAGPGSGSSCLVGEEEAGGGGRLRERLRAHLCVGCSREGYIGHNCCPARAPPPPPPPPPHTHTTHPTHTTTACPPRSPHTLSGADRSRPCSLPKATAEPVRVTAPMKVPSRVVVRCTPSAWPAPAAWEKRLRRSATRIQSSI